MRVLEELEITNFKKFSSLRMRLSEVQVIAGENGSGKTSILWAIMMFLRGYNSLSSNSSHFQNKTSVSNSEVAVLLNYQPLAKSESFTPFKRVGASSPPTVLVAVNNSRYTCTLTLNGKIEIEPSPMIAQNEKIRYAFVSVDSTWAAVINERNTTNTPLTSSHPSQRTRWNSLPLETRVISLISTSIHLSIQEAIRRDLEFIFAKSFIFTTPQSDEPQYVYVKEGGENAAEVEIMYTGAAFRKIFTTLLLLYTLLTAPEAQKVFLIEEPEALLYPSIHERFMQCILQLCKDKVQLIITSNSNSTFSFVDHKDIFVLYSEKEPYGACVTANSGLQSVVDLHLLAANKRLVLCEGPDDPSFLMTMSTHFKTDFRFIHPVHCSGRTQHLEISVELLRKQMPQQAIYVVLDSDFRSVSKTAYHEQLEKKGATVLFWDLPSIENYLFVFYVMSGTATLEFLLVEETANLFFNKMMESYFIQSARDPKNPSLLLAKWNRALLLAERSKTTRLSVDEVTEVARVIHGHLWVKECMHSKTSALIQGVNKKIADWCPSILKVLKEISKNEVEQ